MIWAGVLLGALGCYLLKLAGLFVPQRILENPRVRRIAVLLPVALLAALIVIQTFAGGHRLAVDARLAGVAAAIVAVRLRAPILVVAGVAGVVAALLRLAT